MKKIILLLIVVFGLSLASWSQGSSEQLLKKLKSWKASGLISEEEYTRRKDVVLSNVDGVQPLKNIVRRKVVKRETVKEDRWDEELKESSDVETTDTAFWAGLSYLNLDDTDASKWGLSGGIMGKINDSIRWLIEGAYHDGSDTEVVGVWNGFTNVLVDVPYNYGAYNINAGIAIPFGGETPDMQGIYGILTIGKYSVDVEVDIGGASVNADGDGMGYSAGLMLIRRHWNAGFRYHKFDLEDEDNKGWQVFVGYRF